VNGKGKGQPITGHQGPRGGLEVYLYSFSTSALGGGGWSAPRPGRFTPWKDPVPIVLEAGWAPELVWTCAKNLAPTGIRFPDRPARSQSLYRLSYPAHHENGNHINLCTQMGFVRGQLFFQENLNHLLQTKNKSTFSAIQAKYKRRYSSHNTGPTVPI
jgi:hypothetical protein